jgi:rRNA processing protein Gar1
VTEKFLQKNVFRRIIKKLLQSETLHALQFKNNYSTINVPQTTLTVFLLQKAAIGAIQDVFGPGGTVVQGCYFHFRQAIGRKIRSVRKAHFTLNH